MGGVLRVFEVIRKENRIVESIPFTFSLIIYSIRFRLVIDLLKWYVYEKGKLVPL